MRTIFIAMALAVVPQAVLGQIEPQAGQWKTWVIPSGSQFRLPAPPDQSNTASELEWLRGFVAQRDKTALDQIRYWDAGSPLYRWQEILFAEAIRRYSVNNIVIGRAVGLLNVAAYDAMVAAWDSKYAYNRKHPRELDPSLKTVLPDPASPSYPSEHAVMAGAAATILSYLFPDSQDNWNSLADEASRSRLAAGLNFPTDMLRGLELGRLVADQVVARAKTDGTDAVWKGTVPTGPGLWIGMNPAAPLAGTWKSWVLSSGSQFRSAPPPAYDSPEKLAELAEIKNFPRTLDTNAAALNHAAYPGMQTIIDLANKKIFEYRLDGNAPRVARIFAAVSAANFDATVACWDSKYTYWAARPTMLDPAITTLFPNPNHPSYPAAHGCNWGATGRILAYLLPQDADFFTAQADQAAESRVWAGIHFRSDIRAGLALGRTVADLVIERLSNDGAQ